MSTSRPWAGFATWVTGGKRGLGLAFARAFARRGAAVHITTRDPSSAEVAATLTQLRTDGASQATAHALDLGHADSVAQLLGTLRSEAPLVFVHSAHAFADHTPIVALKPAALESALHTNVVGAYELLRGSARAMRRAGGGRILVVGSLASQVGGVGQAGYIVEKAALGGLSLALACEFGRDGVSCNTVHPGIIDTENVRERVADATRSTFAQLTRAGRLLTAGEVVERSLHLLDPLREVPNGESLLLDDGAAPALRERLRGPVRRAREGEGS